MPTLFPMLDLRLAGFAVALIQLPNGMWELYKIKPVHGKFFFVKFNKYSGGIYELDRTKRMPYKKTAIYMFDSYSGKPINAAMLRELEYFARKNKLHRVTRKDIRNGRNLRRLLDQFQGKLKEIDQITNTLPKIKDNKKRQELQDKKEKLTSEYYEGKDEAIQELTAKGQESQNQLDERIITLQETEKIPAHVPVESVNILDSFPLLSNLVNDGIIEEDMALLWADRVEKGQMDFEELTRELTNYKVFDIQHPTPLSLDLALDDFSSFRPHEVYQYIQLHKNSDKKFDSLASTPVKPMKLGMIMMLGMLVIIGVVILGSANLENFTGGFSLPPMFDSFTGGG